MTNKTPQTSEDGRASAPRYSETGRQLAHVATGSGALLLRWVTANEAMVIAGAALAFNVYALPHLAPSLFRPVERRTHVDPGIVLYPAAVLVLLLLFPDRLDIVAATWGIMAAGDGMATLVGRHLRSPRIPWNSARSVVGTTAFVLLGGAAGAFLCWWCTPRIIPPPYPWFPLWAPLAAAVAAAAAETLPVRLDDNITVPAAAAAVLWSASLLNGELVAAAVAHTLAVLPLAAAANAAAAAAGYFTGTVTRSGALGGAAIGVIIIATAGWGGWALLLATFALAVAASRVGLRRKKKLRIAEPRGGRRGVANAVANTGVAAVAAVLAATTYATDVSLLAFVAALAAGGSDTVASEIGKAWGRRTWLITTGRRVAPGTPGAVSIEGTAAGVAAAAALGGIGIGLGVAPGWALLPVVGAATAGSLIESALAALFESDRILNNDVLNLVNTGAAAMAIVWLVAGFA